MSRGGSRFVSISYTDWTLGVGKGGGGGIVG